MKYFLLAYDTGHLDSIDQFLLDTNNETDFFVPQLN